MGGYVLMNWTSTFSKRNKRKKNNIKNNVPPITTKETIGCQTFHVDEECKSCQEKVQKLDDMQTDISKIGQISDELKRKLSAANCSLAKTMERESKMRNDYETLTLDEAHADRIKALEKTLQEKECDWVTKNENLRRDLRQAIRSSIQDTEREVESIDNLEQEIHSLRTVVEMRSAENRDLRIHNNELLTQVERLTYLESELRNAQHRLDETTL